MFVIEVVLGVIVVLVAAVALAAVGGGGLTPAGPDTDEPVVPTDRPLTSDDLARVRFRTAVRGYRMEDVDAAMASVYATLRSAEAGAEAAPATEHGEATE